MKLLNKIKIKIFFSFRKMKLLNVKYKYYKREFMNLKVYLESYMNLTKPENKRKYIDEIWEMLQIAYKPIGGIKGSGFKSKEDMIENIPFWKIAKQNNKIVAGVMYKDKGYRKGVAVFTDGTKEGKNKLKEMLEADFKRSAIEISHSLLKFYEKTFPELLNKYTISTSNVQKILNDEIEIIDKNYYYIEIGNDKIKKRLIGNIKKLEL